MTDEKKDLDLIKQALHDIYVWHKKHSLVPPGVLFLYEKSQDTVRAEQRIKYASDPYEAVNWGVDHSGVTMTYGGIPLKLTTQEPRY